MCLASLGGAARPSGGLRPCPANRAAHGTGPSPRRCLPPSEAPRPRPSTRRLEPRSLPGCVATRGTRSASDESSTSDAAGVPRSALLACFLPRWLRFRLLLAARASAPCRFSPHHPVISGNAFEGGTAPARTCSHVRTCTVHRRRGKALHGYSTAHSRAKQACSESGNQQ